ncbi:RagB/SusD family nutrient uptake outer membrane protein [Terrimonas pollutisoli]|uniref:RagB/SusD family nutrient uptake outer membrane protein n=1 Tax=Terrimonas pollutisoli TaxID=3034147 RepID=UPI0023ED3774|nr:RagB/SusD family nutrient uptake outer membrane protein [Terrimonas sp. H1YJ31]
MKTGRSAFIIFISIVFICSCKKLNETVGGNLTIGQVANNSAAELLRGVYGSLEPTFTGHFEIFALSDITTDEAIVPTRGNDWDDNGMWRALHQHKWDPGHASIRDCFKSLGGVVFAATDMLQYNPTTQQRAEARFLRAFAMYWLLDLFDQVPYRESGENVIQPAKVRIGLDALTYIISEINDVQSDLPDFPPAGKANKYAAKVLLMKCYLNKAVYKNRANPSFEPADMNKVISLADEIINSGKFSFSDNYFDNFSPVNGMKIHENIFTQLSNADGGYKLQFAWHNALHYTQGGFNGYTTLSKFYNKFESTDKRREAVYTYPGSPGNPGNRVNVGFLIGQQYDLFTGDSLSDGTLPVIFTPEVKNIEPGPNLDMPGIRPIKYAPDYLNFFFWGSPARNEFVYFRFPDVLLMKAEAILRARPGDADAARAIVNTIRTHPSRNATALSSINLDVLFDERGMELWWENWRRQDMIRFGKYLKSFQEKEDPSETKYLLFPIPYEQLAVNHNLVQNDGY